MYTIVALAFCLLLGVMIKTQGISALLWTPLGFAFGLFVTAQMLLPLILGLPRAIRLVIKGQMRAAVFGRILVTPVVWFVLLVAVGFVLGLLWPSALAFLDNNVAFNLGGWLGTIAIILTPLSKKGRSDFRADFDKSYCRFYRDSNEFASRDQSTKEAEAAITVASNLYLHTIKRAEVPPGTLQLNLPDSRYRYLIFCLSTVAAACASEMTNRDAVVNDCLNFLVRWAVENDHEFFGGSATFDMALNRGTRYLHEFSDQWVSYFELEKEDADSIDSVSSMIHSTESNVPAGNADTVRLGELALEVVCRTPAMREAFVELVNR